MHNKQINVNEMVIKRKGITRCLEAYLDSELNFREHIKMKCKAAMINLLKRRSHMAYGTAERILFCSSLKV